MHNYVLPFLSGASNFSRVAEYIFQIYMKYSVSTVIIVATDDRMCCEPLMFTYAKAKAAVVKTLAQVFTNTYECSSLIIHTLSPSIFLFVSVSAYIMCISVACLFTQSDI